jgi:hypothetical protein
MTNIILLPLLFGAEAAAQNLFSLTTVPTTLVAICKLTPGVQKSKPVTVVLLPVTVAILVLLL